MITQQQSDNLARFILSRSRDSIENKKKAFKRIRDTLDSFDTQISIRFREGADMFGMIDRKAYVKDGTFYTLSFCGNLVEIWWISDK